MGYHYCDECEEEMVMPTTGEIVKGEMECPSCCAVKTLYNEDVARTIDELVERIEALEIQAKLSAPF